MELMRWTEIRPPAHLFVHDLLAGRCVPDAPTAGLQPPIQTRLGPVEVVLEKLLQPLLETVHGGDVVELNEDGSGERELAQLLFALLRHHLQLFHLVLDRIDRDRHVADHLVVQAPIQSANRLDHDRNQVLQRKQTINK